MDDPIIKEIVVEEFAKGKRSGLTRDEILKNVDRRVQEYKKVKKNGGETVYTPPEILYGPAIPPEMKVVTSPPEVLYGPPVIQEEIVIAPLLYGPAIPPEMKVVTSPPEEKHSHK